MAGVVPLSVRDPPPRSHMDPARKTVLLIAPRGLAARFMLQTDFLTTLQAAGVRVVVLTPDGVMPTISPEADSASLILEPLRTPSEVPRDGKLRGKLRPVVKVMRRAALSARKSPGVAPRYRRIRAAYTANWPRGLGLLVHVVITQLLWRSRVLRRLVARADLALASGSVYDDVFERHRPDIVVGASLGYFSQDELVFQDAERHGLKTAAVISNWDNPTTRGYRAVPFDLVVAWADRMRDDIVQLHDVEPERVRIGGVPSWDPYLLDGALPSREELCARLGLDPSKRVVFHATRAPTGNSHPFEQIASALAEATSSGRFGEDVQLVVRLHPKAMNPDEGEWRRSYEALARSEGVHINYPEVLGEPPLRYEPTTEDGRLLGGLLKHCDVLVNIFSTTTLEAFLLDRPAVMAAPDAYLPGDGERSHLQDPRLWDDFVHLRPLVESGAAGIAHSKEELIEHVREYLRDPSLDRDRRREIAWLECGPTDGHAGERTAGHVLEAMGLAAASPPGARVEATVGGGA